MHAHDGDGPPAPPVDSAEDLYDGAPCGYVSTDPGGLLTRVNQTFLDWTGLTRDELVGRRRFQQLLAPGDRIFYETHYAPLLQMQGKLREIAVDVVCAGGRRLPVLVNATLYRDDRGRALHVRTTVFDATERRSYERGLLEARRRAEAADRAKGEFISTLSHEIRTPLHAIMAVGHLFASTPLSEQQQKFLRLLRSSSESLLALVNDVLDLSKIEAGMMTLTKQPVDLRDLVHRAVTPLAVKAEEKGLALTVDVDDALPERVSADPVKLTQVLTNLVGNAIKFTRHGAVTVTAERLPTAADATAGQVDVRFRVRDTGIGIAPARQARIFEDFVQASSDIATTYGGTGLGLAITRRLVELHGSRIDVDSAEGAGATFVFTLRLDVVPARPAAAPDTGDARPLAGLRVLIADDNDVNVFVLTGMLERWGIVCEAARNGAEALERVRTGAFDLVLMDLRMPELDGFEVTRRIRALPDTRLARLPVIAVSASVRIGQRHEIDAAGFTDFVGKPIAPDDLFAVVARHSGRS